MQFLGIFLVKFSPVRKKGKETAVSQAGSRGRSPGGGREGYQKLKTSL